jgi:transposase-like protein
VSKSSVSRRFVALPKAQVATWRARPLAHLAVRVIFSAGLHFRAQVMPIALGVDWQGHTHVLALHEGTTANATVGKTLLTDLRERGLDLDRPILVVVDGGSGLRKALRETCGPTALLQRCQVHKRRNLLEHLPASMRPRGRRVRDAAYGLEDAALATRRLGHLAAGLERTHPARRRPCAKASTRS